jgi:type IV secretion system protein VirB10
MSETNTPRPGRDIDEAGSVVAGPRRPQLTALQRCGVAGLVLVVALGFIWLRQLNQTTGATQDAQAPVTTGQPMHAVPLTAPPAIVPASLPMPLAPRAALSLPRQQGETAAQSPILAFSGGSLAAIPAAVGTATTSIAQAVAPALAPASTALSARLKPTVLRGAKAELLPHPDFMMTEGTIIPCTLQTAIDSQLAGYVKCVIPQDIRGTTGDVVLLDKGTTVVGEIQQGLVQGQNRVFVLWDRAETPDHAVIELDSPGTDDLGRSGLKGAVNNHFWERFGSAILLSVIQGGLQTGTALAANSGSGGGTFFNNFQSNGGELANTALASSINIPPTLEKNQGDTVAIFVAKDLDFSDVYGLRVTGDAQ